MYFPHTLLPITIYYDIFLSVTLTPCSFVFEFRTRSGYLGFSGIYIRLVTSLVYHPSNCRSATNYNLLLLSSLYGQVSLRYHLHVYRLIYIHSLFASLPRLRFLPNPIIKSELYLIMGNSLCPECIVKRMTCLGVLQ